jgi:predicted metalloprotease with PDZ domain
MAPRGSVSSSAADGEPPWPGITLDLTPDPERDEVSVEVRVSGDRAATIAQLTVARAWADTRGGEAVLVPTARDARGEIALLPQADDGGPDDVYALARAPAGGDFRLRYRARAAAGRSRFALRIAPDQVSGVGHAFLLLPRIEERVPARIRIHTARLRRGADAASSFGLGAEVVTAATSEDLAHAVYVAGLLWREDGEPGEGGGSGDRLVVLGNPPFDTRTAFDRAEGVRAAVDRFFAGPTADAGPSPAPADPGPFSFVLVAQRALGRAREGAYLTRSLGVWFDTEQPLDGALDLVVAHELTHRFLGGTVRLVGRGGREASWFSEGFTVHFARKALLAAGLLSPADLAADLERTLGDGGEETVPADYRRGALHAAWLDAAVRRASGARRSLDDVIRALCAAGRASATGSLPVSSLAEVLAREIGAAGTAHVEALEARDDTPVDLPDDAFGPCARRTVREQTVFDLGFDRHSLDHPPTLIRGLTRGSPADRAGVREGALVIDARVPAEAEALRRPAEVDLLLAEGKRVRYRPVATRRDIRWVAADCAARGLGGGAGGVRGAGAAPIVDRAAR